MRHIFKSFTFLYSSFFDGAGTLGCFVKSKVKQGKGWYVRKWPRNDCVTRTQTKSILSLSFYPPTLRNLLHLFSLDPRLDLHSNHTRSLSSSRYTPRSPAEGPDPGPPTQDNTHTTHTLVSLLL